jgi:hypothetical protein
MPFTKDTASEAGKMSSRKGIPNKITKSVKDAFEEFLQDNTSELQGLLDRVKKTDPDKALMILYRFSEFITPKQKAIEYKDTTSVEYLLSLEPEEQQKLLIELKKKLEDE